MIRRPLQDLRIRHLDAEFVQADLTDPKSLAQAVKGVDCVLHLGARATFESYDTLRPVILNGSLALMEAAAKAGVKTFVYSSSLLVYGDLPGEVDTDNSSQAGPGLWSDQIGDREKAGSSGVLGRNHLWGPSAAPCLWGHGSLFSAAP